MTRDFEDILVVLADVDRAIEKAAKLDLPATVYLLKTAALEICMAAYGDDNAVCTAKPCIKSGHRQHGAHRVIAHQSLGRYRKSPARISE